MSPRERHSVEAEYERRVVPRNVWTRGYNPGQHVFVLVADPAALPGCHERRHESVELRLPTRIEVGDDRTVKNNHLTVRRRPLDLGWQQVDEVTGHDLGRIGPSNRNRLAQSGRTLRLSGPYEIGQPGHRVLVRDVEWVEVDA